MREMRWWDIDAVLALEKALFPEDAWSRGMFWSELAHSRGPEATRRYVVAEAPGEGGARIVGYAGLVASGEQGDVQTIAVARERWGTGLGARLLTELLRAATAFECSEVMLECRVDNVRAQKLYERFGFEPIGFRRGYYQPGNVDALVMRLADPAAPVSMAGTAPEPSPADPPDSSLPPDPSHRADPANGVQGPETHG
ncbi:ribosomal protein S18-alanine N-acetyltransferase [Streptomyces sp. NPDC046985]|uniref:ribosomal protein S18-alanine N-acetyltransferase n=1 Tax=Streptomyces sp. NPDC046985 TaxID=3155377 RepID=UPI0033C68ADA